MVLCTLIFCGITATAKAEEIATAPAKVLFEQGNEALAGGDAKTALETYLNIAEQHGTSPALAGNIGAAAELANEPGWIEWAKRTSLLRHTEWAIVAATSITIGWALAIGLGAWQAWPLKKYWIVSLPCAISILACLWIVDRWMPDTNEAIITQASPRPLTDSGEENSTAGHPTANILLSPFASAETTGSLPLGARVLIIPTPVSKTPPPDDYVYISHPDSQLKGWMQVMTIRQVGR